jgi:glucose/arabinose dehydrogenase
MTDAARDPAQLPGSVLRYNLDGTIPDDNPFPNSPVYAYGIRNGFGLAFDPQSGQLYESENGASCDDELNLILPGADYGWGVHAYDACPYPDDTGESPVYQWTRVVAPADLMFYTSDLMPEFQGDLLICGHNESKIFHVRLTGNGRAVREMNTVEIPGQYELCRVTLTQGPDGWIYTATADRLLRIGR